MPQIAQILETYASQFFWLLIVFGLIYFGIGRGMLPKVEATIDARSLKIADDLAAAERAQAEAVGAEAAWHKASDDARAAAQMEIAKAKAAAASDGAARLASANAKIVDQTTLAEAAIAEAKAKSMVSIEDVAADAAQDIVAKLSSLTVSKADALAATQKVMANV